MKRVRVIGVGPGDPDLVTLEAVRALREVDYFVVTDKSGYFLKMVGPDKTMKEASKAFDELISTLEVGDD